MTTRQDRIIDDILRYGEPEDGLMDWVPTPGQWSTLLNAAAGKGGIPVVLLKDASGGLQLEQLFVLGLLQRGLIPSMATTGDPIIMITPKGKRWVENNFPGDYSI